jgi:hypothetical protein
MALFDPQKHLKTKQRLADLNTEDRSLAVSTRKPKASEWVRAMGNSIEDFHEVISSEQPEIATGEKRDFIIQAANPDDEERLIQILSPIRSLLLVPLITTHGQFFIWECKQPGPTTRMMEAHTSGRKCALLAQKGWVKIGWDNTTKMYRAAEPLSLEGFPDPKWPTETLEELISLAYEDNRIITNLDHEVVQKARSKLII